MPSSNLQVLPPLAATDAAGDLFLRERIVALDIHIDRVPPDAVELCGGWEKHLRASIPADGQPWIPIGCVGPILIMAHHDPAVGACLLPRWAGGRVKIGPEKYRELARSFFQQLKSVRCSNLSFPENPLPVKMPRLSSQAEAVHFLGGHFVMPRPLRSVVDTMLAAGPARDLPPGVQEAVQFLMYQCPLVDLRLVRPLRELISLAGRTFRQFETVPVARTPRYVFVAGPLVQHHSQAGSFEDKLRVDLASLGRMRVLFALASRERARDIMNTFCHEVSEPLEDPVAEASYNKETELVLTAEELKTVDPQMTSTTEKDIVNWVLGQAILRNSADVHFDYECGEARFRINVDGVLHTLVRLPARRGRIIAGILRDISEFTGPWFLPESRHFSVRFDHQLVDFRAEGTPFRDARGPQMFTLRLLNNDARHRSLADLQILEPHLSRLRDFISMPYGLVLITGPTGSGKTTTMYSAIHEINSPKLKILSVEDPIEQTIEGVDQVQVNEAQGAGFAELLRSFLRSAPNVVMVGEIRDEATAAISLQAANTGHLVIASLHTNTACGSINRLVDSFKVDSAILSDSVVGLQGQRLMRALCPLCKEETPASGALRQLCERHGQPACERVFRAGCKSDCPACRGEGYAGRFVVMETVANGEEFKEAIRLHHSEQQLWQIARRAGCRRLFEEGLQHVLAGGTDERELNKIRVVGD